MKQKRLLAAVLSVCLLMSLAVWKGPGLIKGLLNDEDQAVSTIIESPENTEGNNILRDTVLYYQDDKGLLVPVMRKIPWPEGRGIAKASMRALVDNPANRSDMEGIGLVPILPANTDIIGMSINDGVCKANFTGNVLNYGNITEEQAIVKGIVYTLTEFPTVSEVQIMVDGVSPRTLTFGTDVSSPLAREDINYAGSGSGKGKVIVYYQSTVNGMENYFVPVTKDVQVENNEEVTVIRVLEMLAEGPTENSGLFSVLPEGLQVKNVDVINGIAYVDFSEEIKNVTDESVARDIIKSVALTLKDYYKNQVLIESVSLLADGDEIEFGEINTEEPVAVPTFANEY